MRTTSAAILCAVLALAPTVIAQTAHPTTTAHTAGASHAAAAHTTAGGCVKLPEVSSKIPALPAGSPCPKALFTVEVEPPAKVIYASPLEPDIAKTLGLETNSFTLAYVDTKVGTGPLAAEKKYYTVKYTGYLPDGTVFDASAKHDPDGFTFPIGAHRVIAGWDTGFAGMRVGGKRRLFIPYPLAYGAQGQPPTIPAHTDLIFDMELVSQSDTPPAPPASSASPKPAPLPSPANPAQPPAGQPSTAPTTSAPPAASPTATPPGAQPSETK